MANPFFTLLAFPQQIRGDQLTLNIVFLPRNFSPLDKVSVGFPTTDPLTAFAKAQPKFSVVLVSDPNEFPGKVPANEIAKPATLVYSNIMSDIYTTLRDAKDGDGKPKYFDIDPLRSSGAGNVAPDASQDATHIRKYLPVTYREAFNFTSPRTPNAVTDDSYHCAVRDNVLIKNFKISDGKVSWGKVFAHLMRQPLMAVAGGLIYQDIVITIDPASFKKGGWIYADLDKTDAANPYVKAQADALGAGDLFIRKYAARIPALPANPDQSLFAAVLFPVMKAGESPIGVFDDIFIEAAQYNDGFAAVVHANQPVSANLLKEDPDGMHPQKEAGIRLGWDDEQILIWYMRQLMADKSVPGPVAGSFDRIDVALGVTGYHIDVKDETNGGDWQSLNAVASTMDLALEQIPLGGFKGELPYQVYPVQLQGAAKQSYWLPMYFLNWNDHSIVLPDKDGAAIYRHQENTQKNTAGKSLTNKPTETYFAPDLTTKLRYGNRYSFKVRFCDMSGGAAASPELPKSKGPGVIASIDFKRYIAPNKLLIADDGIATNTDDPNFDGDSLTIGRPLMEYPAVVYTGKYNDPIPALVQASLDLAGKDIAGIPDPDVACVEIMVEVESMQMDNLPSKTGKENYIRLYTTKRNFAAGDFNQKIEIPLEYRDFAVLHLHDFPDTSLPFDAAEDNDTITATDGKIIIPTSRNVRITLRAVCEQPDAYFGRTNSNSADHDNDCRYGKISQLKLRRQGRVETDLFLNTASPRLIQAVYLQPDPRIIDKGAVTAQKIQPAADGMPGILQRLAREIGMETKEDLTLTSPNGVRVQFVCSSKIRHTMAPDNSSVTFAGTNELLHHWLVCTTLDLNRDWSWDGMEHVAFAVNKLEFFEKNTPEGEVLDWDTSQDLPDIELKRAVSFNNQMPGEDGLVHREYTKIIYIDAVDTKPPKDGLPDELRVWYRFRPRFKNAEILETAEPVFVTPKIELPTTINPFGIPKLIGAGIALSPYNRSKKYASTESRRRFLWLEFEKEPENPDDGLFARVLASAPDQLLSNNHPSLYGIPIEPPLSIDPEFVRLITPASAREHNGLSAMQKMKKAVDPTRHFYLLPIPSGMHAESAELFGFFTYEFRFGHTDKVWSTAQGRFGRPLRVTGLQHPAPTLTCTVDRDNTKVKVSAPYAQAVANGKNMTANPPRTSIWCLLYAQVKQADGLDYRNILLDQRKLEQPSFELIQAKIAREPVGRTTLEQSVNFQQRVTLNKVLYKDAIRYAQTEWSNDDITSMLYLYGLPGDAPLSVLCVEMFGTTTSLADHITDFHDVERQVATEMEKLYGTEGRDEAARMSKNYDQSVKNPNTAKPLSDDLGFHRILRTSPLAEVPFVCCADC